MNIFVVDLCPERAARDLCNQHVVKMASETGQMLCSASNLLGTVAPWASAYIHHPCTKWPRQSLGNWQWLIEHGLALCAQYTQRYSKRHRAQNIIEWCATHGARPSATGLTDFVQAMPDKYKSKDPVAAYRNYYINEKLRFARWEPHAKRPDWVAQCLASATPAT